MISRMTMSYITGFLLTLLLTAGGSCIPRNSHPERTPSPLPSCDGVLVRCFNEKQGVFCCGN